jgi:hypothetical protein
MRSGAWFYTELLHVPELIWIGGIRQQQEAAFLFPYRALPDVSTGKIPVHACIPVDVNFYFLMQKQAMQIL